MTKWVLIVLWANGVTQEFTGIDSEQACQDINQLLRQQIVVVRLLNPSYACIPESSDERAG